jgi:phage recombination protein Bet
MKTENEEKSIVEFVPFGTKDKIQLSIEIVKQLIAVKTKSGKTASDQDAFKFMLMCQARRLNPFEGDAYLVGYDSQSGPSFSLITSHQAFLKRAELNPEFDGMDSGTIVMRDGKITDLVGDWHMPNDKILGGWATVYFKNRKHAMTKRVRLERFNKNYGIWRDDPAGMVVKCAEADALRSSFPTMLGGMYVEQEMQPVQTEIARPVFEAHVDVNGGAETQTTASSEIVPEPRAGAALLEEPAPKKRLQRKKAVTNHESARRSTEPEPTNHEKFVKLLAVGNCTPHDFIQVALEQDWLTLDQNSFEKISEEQLASFMEAENWNVIMQLLDERRAKLASTGITKAGELL